MATRTPRKTAQKPVTIRKSAPAGKVASMGPIDPHGPLSVRPNKRIAFGGPSKDELVRHGRKVVEAELAAVNGLHQKIDRSFAQAVELILSSKGRLVVTGLGKPGFVAQKISATFASTGTPSLYLHPAEALHGDLGRVTRDDVVLALSNSGRTEEIVRLLGPVGRIGAKVIAMTGDVHSPLAEQADVVLDIGNVEEACPLGLAPTASSTVLLVLGDALAMTVLDNRAFGNDDYALIHPGGSLGTKVMRVREVMRQGDANPVVRMDEPLSRAVAVMTQTPGRPGATLVVDRRGKLAGIFTDGDLRRLFEAGTTSPSTPIGELMGKDPRTVHPEMLVLDAAEVLRESRIDQVPVVDDKNRPLGLLDVQDLLAVKVL
ncbi:SIS domain-containing protein [Vulgatibacter sp.]|uniref:KpsF/GutQ family sugar-phosphate isomerase n=1 Tax=Vulgatibacter sp. TaxID=1971226 RepID=UPI00356614AA